MRERGSPMVDGARKLLVGSCSNFPVCAGKSKTHINRVGGVYGRIWRCIG